jgi:hypothetical protein
MKQTAVELLVERIKLDSKSKENSNGGISFTIGLSKIDEILEQSKEMEREQIVKAYTDTLEFTPENISKGEQYYNENYNL